MEFTTQTHFNYSCGLNVDLDCILAFGGKVNMGEGKLLRHLELLLCHPELVSGSKDQIFKILKQVQNDKNLEKAVKQVQGNLNSVYGGVV